jgi:tetratricopeptide (TPR) repeat protein
MKRAGKALILLGIVLFALSPVASGDQFVTSMKIYLQLNPPSYDKAIVQGEEGLKDAGAAKNWELHAMVAECYASVGRYEEAGKQYQEAMALNPAKKKVIEEGDGKYINGRNSKWDLAFYTGAELRMKAGFTKVAVSDLALTEDMKKTIADFGQPEEVRQGTYQGKPMVVFTYWSKGTDLKFRDGKLAGKAALKDPKTKDYAELALRELKGAIALDPEKAQAYEQLAALYDRLGRRNEMVAMLQEALKADPKNAVLHTSLGTVYENDGKFELALQEFTEATKLDTTIFRAWAGLGESQLNLKHYAEAVEGFQRATALDTTNKDVFFNLGLAYFNLEKYDNALKAFKRVVAKDPTDCDGWAFVGHSTLNLNDEKGALESYEKATAPTCNLTPAYAPSVWQTLCRLYTRKNMMDKAKTACKKAEELAPKK